MMQSIACQWLAVKAVLHIALINRSSRACKSRKKFGLFKTFGKAFILYFLKKTWWQHSKWHPCYCKWEVSSSQRYIFVLSNTYAAFQGHFLACKVTSRNCEYIDLVRVHRKWVAGLTAQMSQAYVTQWLKTGRTSRRRVMVFPVSLLTPLLIALAR